MDTNAKKLIQDFSKMSQTKLEVVEKGFGIWIELDSKQMPTMCKSCSELGGVFDSAFAYPYEKRGEWSVAYFFRFSSIGKMVVLWAHASVFHSVSKVLPASLWDERKMHELSGKEFIGIPDERPLIAHPESSRFSKVPARKKKMHEYKFFGTGAEEEFQIPVGPVHAGIIESGHFRFHVVGEKINKLEVRLSYLHKGIEELASDKEPESLFPLIEQVSGDESVANSVSYAQAVESAMSLKVSSRANSIRLILLELERIYSHLSDLGGISMDIGYYVSSSQFLVLREEMMRHNQTIYGNRFLRGLISIGGLSRDIPTSELHKTKEFLKRFSKTLLEIEKLTMASSTFLDRVFTTGMVFQQTAKDLALVGPTARASGISCDLRKHFAYGAYKHNKLRESLALDGDVLARFMVKLNEIKESVRLISSETNKISNGPISQKTSKIKRKGSGIGICEAPRGASTFVVFLGEGGKITRILIRTASFRNWRAIEKAVKSNIIADFPVINKSFNLSYSGTDL